MTGCSSARALADSVVAWASELPLVRGIAVSDAMEGVDGTTPVDARLVLLVEDVERCTAELPGARHAAAVWLAQPAQPPARPHCRTVRALVEGGSAVDILVLAQAGLADGSAAAALAHGPCHGLRVRLDRDGQMTMLAAALGLPERVPPAPPLSEAELRNDVESFRSAVIWTAKHLRRGELWYTRRKKLDVLLRDLLQRMIASHAWATTGARTSAVGLGLERWADPRAREALAGTFARHDLDDMVRSLDQVMTLYRWLAGETAAAMGCSFARPTDHRIYEWVAACLAAMGADESSSHNPAMDELKRRIVAWSDVAEIRAIVVYGSQAVAGRADVWSDLDMIVLSTEPDRCIEEDAWLLAIGEPWATTKYRAPTDGTPNVLGGHLVRALFQDALECDFLFVEAPVEGAPLPAKLEAILAGDHLILRDKDGLLAARSRGPDAARGDMPAVPTPAQFQDAVHRFLGTAAEAAIWLRAGELWYARAAWLDEHLKFAQLTPMLTWHAHVRGRGAADQGLPERRFERWVDPRWLARVPRWFPAYDAASTAAALLDMLEVFDLAGREVAGALGYTYPAAEVARATGWIHAALTSIGASSVAPHLD